MGSDRGVGIARGRSVPGAKCESRKCEREVARVVDFDRCSDQGHVDRNSRQGRVARDLRFDGGRDAVDRCVDVGDRLRGDFDDDVDVAVQPRRGEDGVLR